MPPRRDRSKARNADPSARPADEQSGVAAAVCLHGVDLVHVDPDAVSVEQPFVHHDGDGCALQVGEVRGVDDVAEIGHVDRENGVLPGTLEHEDFEA